MNCVLFLLLFLGSLSSIYCRRHKSTAPSSPAVVDEDDVQKERIILSARLNSTKGGVVRTCERGIVLPLDASKDRTVDTFHIPWAPRKSRCIWTLAGSDQCDVELSCSVDIPAVYEAENERECAVEYLKITDGSSGKMTVCGKVEISGLRASEGLRDLFVLMEYKENPENSTQDESYKGVTCTVKCGGQRDRVKARLAANIKRNVDNRCVCGLQNNGKDRIVGGDAAVPHEYPWLAVVVEAGTRMPECGASVLNDRYILSAAHCIDATRTLDEIEVLLHAHLLDQTKLKAAKDVEWGEKGSTRSPGWNLSQKTDADENSQRFKVIQIITHPLFDKSYDYDYSILKLDRKININGDARKNSNESAVTPVCIPSAVFTWKMLLQGWKNMPDKILLTVAGWGKSLQNAGGSTRLLQKLTVPYIENSICRTYMPNRMTYRMFCAGFDDGEKDACVGDSGGPLVYQEPTTKQFMQVGVVSWGIGCAKAKKPGVYAKTTEISQWIDFHTLADSKWCSDSLGNLNR